MDQETISRCEDAPGGWNPVIWNRVRRVAHRMTRSELIWFYRRTGAIKADDLSTWSKRELLGVLDEIGEDAAEDLLSKQ